MHVVANVMCQQSRVLASRDSSYLIFFFSVPTPRENGYARLMSVEEQRS